MVSFSPVAGWAVLTGWAVDEEEEEEGPWKEEEGCWEEEVPSRGGMEACLDEMQEEEEVHWEEIVEGTSFLKEGAPTLEEKETASMFSGDSTSHKNGRLSYWAS